MNARPRILIDLPPGGERVVVRLDATSRFWEIDQVELASGDASVPKARVLAPVAATTFSGHDVRDAILTNDGNRVVLRPREHVDVRFEAPAPSPGSRRTVVARLQGFYELDIGGVAGVNVGQVIAHRLGWVSLPDFAQGLNYDNGVIYKAAK